jgi:hypothetical protein
MECVEKIETDYDVEYSEPERVTKLEAYINLLAASREIAVEDGELGEWEDVFLMSSEWNVIWRLLKINENFVKRDVKLG